MRKSNRVLFWAVSLGHLSNDTFMSMRGVLLAFISAYVLPLASWQIGLALSAVELMGALSQPVFGWLADRTGGRWLGAGGVAWTVSGFVIAMIIVSLGGSFWLMLIPMALAGLGSGAFHPVGSMYATDVDSQRSARNASVFFLFGQLGLGLGPALTGLLLEGSHTHYNDLFAPALGPAFRQVFFEFGSVNSVFVLALFAIPAVLVMALTIPSRQTHKHSVVESARSSTHVRSDRIVLPVRPFLILGLAVALRGLGSLSTVSFMPLIFQLKGWSPSEYGALTSSFWVASGFAGVVFGYLGDRFDLRRVITISLLITAPGVFLLPGLDGLIVFVVAIIVGAMGGSHSLIVVLAQGLLPGRKGFASGVILGFIFATGAIGSLIVGSLIDRLGVVTTFHLVAVITLAGGFLWLALPAPKGRLLPEKELEAEVVPAGAD